MKLGFFTNAFKNFSFEYAVEALGSLGYKGIELWCKGQHATPYDSDARVAYLKKLAISKGLEIYALSAHLDFITENEELRMENIKKFKKVIELAKKFKVKKVITASGYLNDKNPDKDMEKRFLNAMSELGEYAQKKKIIIALEPEPEKFLRTPKQAVRFIEEADIPVFKTVCDLSHAIALNMSPEDFVSEMQSYLGHVHLDDALPGEHPHRHLIPGEGSIDYQKFFRFLEDINYRDWISIELNQHTEYPKAAAEKAMKFLEKVRR